MKEIIKVENKQEEKEVHECFTFVNGIYSLVENLKFDIREKRTSHKGFGNNDSLDFLSYQVIFRKFREKKCNWLGFNIEKVFGNKAKYRGEVVFKLV